MMHVPSPTLSSMDGEIRKLKGLKPIQPVAGKTGRWSSSYIKPSASTNGFKEEDSSYLDRPPGTSEPYAYGSSNLIG